MDSLQKKPPKGILRTSSNSGQSDHSKTSIEPIKWDEMNILQTLHPPGKDYGLMKIEEPKTPFSHYKDTVDGEPISDDEEVASSSATNLDLQMVSEKIKQGKAKILCDSSVDKEDDEDENESEPEELSEEEMKKRKEFEMKRKMHYNEFQAVKLARKLLEEDDDEDEEDNNKDRSATLNDDEEGMASDREVELEYAHSKLIFDC
ncbi:protein phosphatase inhibitor 2-like isoform X2 [Panonychus citri]|uniref:protein phosphatase inhibitor 2-like isoform X2 n=1 Tax=Panonychus citri TaxID=50023 RepID=UPI00230756E2|nr:protein phosphatase inhibitor 2-like isoform X2 [Panonychus citri]